MQEKTTTIIEPREGIGHVGLAEIFRYRELLYFLALRDIKIRYKQTAIGVGWALLQPLAASLIVVLIFGAFVRFDASNLVPYPVYVLSGMVLWLFLFTSVTMTSNVFVGNVNLVTKVYFPRLIFPIASTLAAATELLISVPILLVVALYFGTTLAITGIFAAVAIVMLILLASGIGVLFSALNVRFRDIKFALPFFLQIWMIASPIFYPIEIVPEKWRMVWALNPMLGILSLWRSLLFGGDIDLRLVLTSLASVLVICLIALMVFRSMEDDFADIL